MIGKEVVDTEILEVMVDSVLVDDFGYSFVKQKKLKKFKIFINIQL